MAQPTIHVIFRTCNVVNAVNKDPRPFNFSKTEIIKVCFKSLYNAIQTVPHTITVIGDKLTAELETFFLSYINITYSNGNYGNDASIRKGVAVALTNTNLTDWIYFCEDDYLHTANSFTFIYNLILAKDAIYPGKTKRFFWSKKKIQQKPNIVIFPNDYPDRYLPNDRTQHFIFHTNDCHWRQVTNTTFTFLMQLEDVKKYHDIILTSSKNANDAYLSKKLFGYKNFTNKLLCVSPIPTLTAHLHQHTMPPFMNCEEFVKQYL